MEDEGIGLKVLQREVGRIFDFTKII